MGGERSRHALHIVLNRGQLREEIAEPGRRRAAARGSGEPNREKVGTVTRAQLEEIANVKMVDLNANDIDAAVNIIAATARSMGLEVEG